ncbi:hypothetical protein K474DRAFT_1629115 [Panus rudis PR-1116 ss-1]|nr:hypothetical protein K474DRAFT_1629115 [Panus rudis PR-1116 ss-1]
MAEDTTIHSDTKPERKIPPLDPEFYSLDDEEANFFKTWTGIQDEEQLKEHMFRVREKAYKVFPYPCIRRFAYAKLKISRFPAYQDLLKLGRERPGALFLDMACCFGNDARKAVADGFPVKQVLASDLRPEFWQLGHELFRDTPEKFPATFIPGDVFDPNFLAVESPSVKSPTDPLPPLSNLKTLTPLHGRLSAIHASSFFHLFDEEQQLYVAKALASLLSPEPGSIIFGAHGGKSEKGFRIGPNVVAQDKPMFCHSPQSWTELWEKQVFQEGQVRVWTKLVDVTMQGLDNIRREWLLYSVTRL